MATMTHSLSFTTLPSAVSTMMRTPRSSTRSRNKAELKGLTRPRCSAGCKPRRLRFTALGSRVKLRSLTSPSVLTTYQPMPRATLKQSSGKTVKDANITAFVSSQSSTACGCYFSKCTGSPRNLTLALHSLCTQCLFQLNWCYLQLYYCTSRTRSTQYGHSDSHSCSSCLALPS